MRTTVKRGFTLLEALVAMFVIALAVICFLPGFLGSRSLITRNQFQETATQIAETQMESMRQLGYANVPAIASGASSTNFPLTVANSLPGAGGSVTITYLTSALATSTTDKGRKRIDVTVTWTQGTHDNGSTTLSSIIVRGS